MNKKCILACILVNFLLLCVPLCFAGDHEKKEESEHRHAQREAREHGQVKLPKKALLKSLGLGAAVQLGGLIFTYHADQSFKSYVDDASDEAGHYVLRKALSAHLKVNEIRDKGFSGKDLLFIILCLAGLCGAKKTWDFFHVGSALTGDLRKTKRAVEQCMMFASSYRREIGIVMLGSLAAYGGMKLFSKNAEEKELSLTDQFLETVSHEQRTSLKRAAWQSLQEKLYNDPTTVKEHKAFMHMLTTEQKNLLDQIIEEYIENNPHLALVDEGQ